MVSRKKRKWKFSKEWEENVRMLARDEINKALEICRETMYREIERDV